MFLSSGDDLDYKLNITDSSNPEKSLVYLENELIDQDVFLASLSNDVTIEVTGKVIHSKYYNHLKKSCSAQTFGLIKMGWFLAEQLVLQVKTRDLK